MKFDYIVIGAGSAGCVLANRLSRSGRHSVLVVEAGGSDRRFWIQTPIGYGRTFFDESVNWKYVTRADPGLANRTSYWPRGKVLGGSSSINAMVFIRGQQDDFNGWAKHDNPGWDWQGVFPYFKKMEHSERGDPRWRGKNGPVNVEDVAHRVHHLCETFIEAGQELGLPFNPDFNGASQHGVGIYQITTKNARRMSTARAYLRPARNRSNLDLIMATTVDRIVFENRRAVGVEFSRNGVTRRAQANLEVLVCAGAINSPKLLQLSGIGDARHLSELEIDVVHHSPMVGRNLQDHLGIDYFFRSRIATLNDELHSWYGKITAGLKYLIGGGGPLSLSVNQGGGFCSTAAIGGRPNLQLYFSPVSYLRAPSQTRPLMNPDPFSGFLIGIQPLRPSSRGFLKIASADPNAAPEIYPNYLSTQADLDDMHKGVQYIRKLAGTKAFSKVIDHEMIPGPGIAGKAQIIDDIRTRSSTVFHPCGTCRMGADAENNVVGPDLKVHGLANLRVADASVFPNITSGNTNAPAIMVAEKAADLILGNSPPE